MSEAKGKKEPRYERFGSDGTDIKVDGKALKGKGKAQPDKKDDAKKK